MFVSKEKEPILSQPMADIINRSTGDRNIQANTDEIVRSKYTIKKVLTSNEDLLSALHCKNADKMNGDAYLGVSIFDYMRLPDMKDEVKNYICFDINEGVPNYLAKQIDREIIFRVVSHKSDVETDWGVNRPDLMSAIIQSEFDWSNVLGLKLVKQYNTPMVVDNDYYYREISYRVESPNNIYNQNK